MPESTARLPPRPVMVSATFMDEAEAHIEALCGILKLDRAKDRYAYSRLSQAASSSPMSDDDLGKLVTAHNRWCERTQAEMHLPDVPYITRDTELTQQQSVSVGSWARPIILAPNRWSAAYTETRLKELYETLRGRSSGGLHLAYKALSVEQADEVINLLAYQLGLDRHDLRLETPRTWELSPKGRRVLRREDRLDLSAGQYGQGHIYCEKCGVPVAQGSDCPRRKCPIAEDLKD